MVCKLVINGGKCLCGEIRVQGSKNAALPILAASLLSQDECVIHNCPDISDTFSALEILKGLGGEAEYRDGTAVVRAGGAAGAEIPEGLMKKMRSSLMFLGPLLAKNGEAVICSPGGCRLGERPIDIHMDSLQKLGADFSEKGNCTICKLGRVRSETITLMYPSVGATENIMLLCAGREADVRIINPAREPEIVDLQNFLNMMGADIRGAGTDMIRIYPRSGLHGCEYRVMPDRIAAATYGFMAAMCGGDIYLLDAECEHIKIVTALLRDIGCQVYEYDNGLRIKSCRRLRSIREIKTLPYPAFPTDVQPFAAAAMSVAGGTSKICETIFDNRFGYTDELIKMGADIHKDGCCITINGVSRLKGASVAASDLRGGAALVAAGLAAEGRTYISGLEYIDRGYENIERVLSQVGADIERI